MFTVSQLQKELQVSKQAIYEKLKQDKYKAYVSNIKGVKVISKEGVKYLKEAYGIKDDLNIDDKEVEKIKNKEIFQIQGNKEYIKSLKEQIDLLKGQVEMLDKQNNKLLELMDQQNKLLLNSQKLQEKSLTNVELILIDKRMQLEQRQKDYINKRNSWFSKLFTNKRY